MAKKDDNYFSNLFKEGGQFINAWRKSFDADAGIGPGANQKAVAAAKKLKAEQGQFLGALVQGRRYNKKGQQQ